MKKYLIFSLLILIFAGSFLFSEKPELLACGHSYRINNQMSIGVHCDAWEFVRNAEDPSRIFEKDNVRQSRPMYTFIATTIGYPLKHAVKKAYKILGFEYSDTINPMIYYSVFVLINFLICFFTLIFFDKTATLILSKNKSDFLIIIFAILFMSNDLVKAFFWTAHQQLFNFFTPVFCIYIMMLILQNKIRGKNLYWISVFVGFGMLVYGSFLLVLPCMLLALFFRNRWKFSLPLLKKGAIIAGLVVLPTILWIGIVTKVNGYYYNHEITSYRELVWITDTLGVSFTKFHDTFFNFTSQYFAMVGKVIIGYILIYFLIIFINKHLLKINNQKKDHSIELSLITTGSIFFVFFWLLGYYQERLVFWLIPIVFYLILIELNPLLLKFKKPYFKYIIVGLVLLYHTHNVFKYGPFV